MKTTMRTSVRTFAAVLSILLVTGLRAQAATAISFTLDTASLVSHPAGPFSLVFSLRDGSGIGDGNNSVTVSQVDVGGGVLIGPPTLFGCATGSLAESVVLTDTSVLNFVVQQFTPGASLTFTIVVPAFNEEEGEIPDGIAFAILDSSGTPVPTTAPAGDY